MMPPPFRSVPAGYLLVLLGLLAGAPTGLSAQGHTDLIGQVDTPAQDQAGVAGAIGVTGWVVSDVGLASIKVYRDCLSAEPPANCQSGVLPGVSLVFIGDAVLVRGARPDIEAAFPNHPSANQAGFGLGVLTNLLPRTTGTFAEHGGQGPLTFYVIATDVEGHSRLLSRSHTDATVRPTSITMDNDNTLRPFGTIDTPAPGATVSGTVVNAGWVTAPTGVSTIFVFIDGLPVSLTARTTDARGAYNIDTTTLENGLHTIAWSVTDNANRIEGIGSRFFTVVNRGADASQLPGSNFELRTPELARAPSIARGSQAGLDIYRPSRDGVWARTGFDLQTPFEVVYPVNGVRHLQIDPSGRAEVWLGPVDDGYLVANGTLRDLPPGSHLDPATGQFTWAPGPGYLGTYRIAFLRGTDRVLVDVTIR